MKSADAISEILSCEGRHLSDALSDFDGQPGTYEKALTQPISTGGGTSAVTGCRQPKPKRLGPAPLNP